jgi:suppressor of G2 allele of SKP1
MVGLIAGRWPFTAMDISGPVPVPPKPFPFPPEYFREPLPTPAELAMDAAAKGNKASADSDYALAIEYYTKALTEMPRAPGYFISRSTAYSRLKTDDGKSHFEAAFNDAEIATRLAFDRGNRELLISAQMRRAVSLYQLGRLGDAAFLFEILETKLGTTKPKADKQEGVQAAMSGSDAGSKTNYTTQLPIWLAKVRRQAMEKADGDDKWTVTIEEIPDNIAIPTVPELKAQLSAVKAGNMQELARAKAAGTLPKAKKREPMVVEKAANFRHDWYQTNDYVYVTLYVNNLNHDVFSIKFLNDSVRAPFEFCSGSKLT